jgi:hypothetical protein
MTAQELRTVKAVLRNRAAAIIERPNDLGNRLAAHEPIKE